MTKTKNRKQVVETVSVETVDACMELASELGLETMTIPGNLLDSHMIITDGKMSIGRYKPRKYLIFRETYLNCWSSGIEMTFTDNEDLGEAFYKEWEAYVDELESEC